MSNQKTIIFVSPGAIATYSDEDFKNLDQRSLQDNGVEQIKLLSCKMKKFLQFKNMCIFCGSENYLIEAANIIATELGVSEVVEKESLKASLLSAKAVCSDVRKITEDYDTVLYVLEQSETQKMTINSDLKELERLFTAEAAAFVFQENWSDFKLKGSSGFMFNGKYVSDYNPQFYPDSKRVEQLII